ncbi:hypothetical protein [Kribbella sp. NPDC000426]|uniref:hypothetical protein n=1 Tax=Kribbella sp. NPDC000426 TaxID=3154255 RepID=UPI00332CE81E
MTVLLAIIFVTAAAAEVAGLGLIVLDVRESRRRWDSFEESTNQEAELMEQNLVYRLDNLYTRYGFTGNQVLRSMWVTESLVTINRRRQNLAIALLGVGIGLGLLGNLLGLG